MNDSIVNSSQESEYSEYSDYSEYSECSSPDSDQIQVTRKRKLEEDEEIEFEQPIKKQFIEKTHDDGNFANILNKIFGFISSTELIHNASLVSKSWYYAIGKLKSFDEQVTLNFISNRFNKKNWSDVAIVKRSERFYQDINIQIDNQKQEIRAVEEIIRKYSTGVEKLKFIKYGGFNCMLNECLDLPNLIELELQIIAGRLNGKFLWNSKTIEKLVLNGIEIDGCNQILINNCNLKELTLYENSEISYFKKDYSKSVKFQLKKLAVYDHISQYSLKLNGEYPAVKWSYAMRKNFFKLVSTQNQLKNLYLDYCNVNDFIHITSSIIEVLEINEIIGDLTQIEVDQNNKIKAFATNSQDMNFICVILKNFKNLRAIFVEKILNDDFLQISNLIQTSSIKFYYFWSHQAGGKFFDLKKLNFDPQIIIRSTKNEFLKMF